VCVCVLVYIYDSEMHTVHSEGLFVINKMAAFETIPFRQVFSK